MLREPLESGEIHISRAARQSTFPARFQLIAAMNPCPCGNLGNLHQACVCTPTQISQYRSRLSGPLLDRMDIQIEVPSLPVELLQKAPEGEALDQYCALQPEGARLLTRAADTLHLSARGYHRVLRLARSIADLEESATISLQHLAEAIQYRRLAQTLAF